MIQKKKKLKLIFLKKIIKKNISNKIIKSIIQNSEIKIKFKQFYILKNNNFNKNKKNCLFGISNKYVEKKSKFSRFAFNKIVNNNLTQNFNKFEK